MREFVGFEGLWSMAIDVPYSYLVRDQDLAWSCGQLALDQDSAVLHPGDLSAQSDVVCDYLEQILRRAHLDLAGVRRLYLYHAATDSGDVANMIGVFRQRVGPETLLVPIAIPHFYYEGILLEVDLWWAQSNALTWVAATTPHQKPERLSEHYFVPSQDLSPGVGSGLVPDPGAVIDGGALLQAPAFHAIEILGQAVSTEVQDGGDVVIVVRRSGPFTWLQGRATDGAADLVAQTEAVMAGFDTALPALGLGYGDVVKSTTHYRAGASADELHENMAVRNRRYRKPGPASTGLPVFGFADRATKIVVDLTLVRR